MARKKVALKYIVNDSKRKASLKKRKNSLIKKVDEITTLCGVEACAIIHAPDDESHTEVWPSPLDARRVISKFCQMPEVEQNKKMVTQETYLRQKIQKTHEQVKTLRTENKKKEMNILMFQCLSGGETTLLDNATIIDLKDLAWVIDQNIKEIITRISKLEVEEGTSNGGAAINGEQEEQGETMDKQPCLVNTNIINDDQVQPFGDVSNNLQNDFVFAPLKP